MFYKIIGFYEWGKGAPHLTAVMRAIVKFFFMMTRADGLTAYLPAISQGCVVFSIRSKVLVISAGRVL